MGRVLVVEDSYMVASTMVEAIEREGHEALGPAATAEAAMELARRERPDLVILDLKLADGDVGQELAERIVAETDAPVLICSAYGEWTLRRVEERVHPCATVAKPIDFDALRRAIESCLGGGGRREGEALELRDSGS
jgi:DNA-binding response OmpR family regulator